MNSLNSMRQKLKPLGFYNLNDTSLISAELSAYAQAINIIETLLDEIEKECFLATAQSYGLSIPEKMLGSEQSDKSYEDRRNSLLYRYSITANDFNKESIEKVLSVAGVNGYIIEVPEQNTMYINCLSLNDEIANKDEIKKQIEEFLPAHLNCIFDFRNLQWDTIDNNDKTFNEMDSQDLTWDNIDNFDDI